MRPPPEHPGDDQPRDDTDSNSAPQPGPPGYDAESAADWSRQAAHGGPVSREETGKAEADDGEEEGEVWLEGEIEVLDETPPRRPLSRRSGGASGVVAAAMLGLGEVLEPEKTKVEIVQVDDQPLEPPPMKLDFSDVPPDDREPPDNKAQL